MGLQAYTGEASPLPERSFAALAMFPLFFYDGHEVHGMSGMSRETQYRRGTYTRQGDVARALLPATTYKGEFDPSWGSPTYKGFMYPSWSLMFSLFPDSFRGVGCPEGSHLP